MILRIEWIRILPQGPENVMASLISSARWALTLALYGSLLFSIGYAARKRFFTIMTVICTAALSLCFIFAISFGLNHLSFEPAAQSRAVPLGENGLILSHSLGRNETAIVLLRGAGEPRGPRVVAIPDRPLAFQAEALPVADLTLPPIPFRNEIPWFLRSLSIDIRLGAQEMYNRFNQGVTPFFIYYGALVFFLTSLGFIFKFSSWPFAGLFLAVLAFRGVLAMEAFFNLPETQNMFGSFAGNILPAQFTAEGFTPLIFCALGILFYIYSALVFAVKKAKK